MTQSDSSPLQRPGLTRTEWLICIIAAIGFAFDIYELLMLPLIVQPALLELLNVQPYTREFEFYVGLLFFVPALVGGVFGLLGGYLTDRLGRRRVLTWSILLYAFSAFAAGFSTSFWMLLVLRCLTFVGVCVEFVAAVAWLAELFPDRERREKVLGYTQAFSSVGGLLVTGAYALAVKIDPARDWRLTLMSGIIPALPLIIIRPFLPESPAWERKRAAGTLRRPSIRELFSPALRRTTIVTTVMFACSYGAAFGAIQHIPRIVPGFQDVKASAAPLVQKAVGQRKDLLAASKSPDPKVKADAEYELGVLRRAAAAPVVKPVVAGYQTAQEIGGLIGRFLLALLVLKILSMRGLLRVFQVPGMLILPAVFAYLAIYNQPLFSIGPITVTSFGIGIFLAGMLTVAQFSFWGNYLPRVYPLHLRGTGESFAANIGGRMIGTSFALVTTTLAGSALLPGEPGPQRLAYAAAIVGGFVYVVGFIFSFFLPQPPHEDQLDEDHPKDVRGAGLPVRGGPEEVMPA